MKRGSTDAETCRLNGWVPGTRLIGEENGRSATITITAIGHANVLAIRDGWSSESVWSLSHREWRRAPGGCGRCMVCYPSWRGMFLCATCGNKRCPHASDCRNACTGSNEPGQAATPPFGRPAKTLGEPTDKIILDILGVSEEAVAGIEKRHAMHKVLRFTASDCPGCVGPIGGES